MQPLIFATGNQGKVKEVRDFINLPSIQIRSLNELPKHPFPEAVEDGDSFYKNAQKKARHYYKILKEPLIADDSGLVVPALNGEPGIYSARYAGANATDSQNNNLLLQKLAPLLPEARKAYFKAVVFYKDDMHEVAFEGKCWGRIIESPAGSFGFGYDPLFYLEEIQKTFAELGSIEKNKYSHRGKAITALKKFLLNRMS